MINPEAVTQEIECPKEHPSLLCLLNHGRSFSIPHEVKRISCDKPIHKSFYTDGTNSWEQTLLKCFRAPKTPEADPRKDSQALLDLPTVSEAPGRAPQNTAEPRCKCNASPAPPAPISQTPADEQLWLYPNRSPPPWKPRAPPIPPVWPPPKEAAHPWLTVGEGEDGMDAGVQLGEALQQRGVVLDVGRGGAAGPAQGTRGVHVAAAAAQAATVGLGTGGTGGTGHWLPGTAQGECPEMQLCLFDTPCVFIYRNTECICR